MTVWTGQNQDSQVGKQLLDTWHHDVVLELSRQFERDRHGGLSDRTGKSIVERDLRSDIDRSIKAIESAGSVIESLNTTIREHEDTIYDLRKRLAESQAHMDVAYQQAAKAEINTRLERERAADAEARAAALETQVKALEHGEALAKAHLDRVMRSVRATFFASNANAAKPKPLAAKAS